MTSDPFLPFVVCPAAGDECYVVRGRAVGPFVEISLSQERRQTRRFASDRYTLIELIVMKRFRRGDIAARQAYANHLEDAASVAAHGQLGYTVHTVAESGTLRMSLVGRTLEADGRVRTEIVDEHTFQDADSELTLVQANEKAVELRARAAELTEEWVARRNAQLLELRAEYEEADAQGGAGDELQRILDAEAD